jgi:hypothetical protein
VDCRSIWTCHDDAAKEMAITLVLGQLGALPQPTFALNVGPVRVSIGEDGSHRHIVCGAVCCDRGVCASSAPFEEASASSTSIEIVVRWFDKFGVPSSGLTNGIQQALGLPTTADVGCNPICDATNYGTGETLAQLKQAKSRTEGFSILARPDFVRDVF